MSQRNRQTPRWSQGLAMRAAGTAALRQGGKLQAEVAVRFIGYKTEGTSSSSRKDTLTGLRHDDKRSCTK